MSEISIQNVEVSLDNHKILKGIDFKISSGKILALIGPNGAGKSTCMRTLAGLIKPDTGKVSINSKSLNSFSDLRASCGYLIEGADFYGYLSAIENLNLLSSLSSSMNSPEKVLSMVGLSESAHKKVKQFSMGMKQRLGIAQALLSDPDFLILDEPFNGLDIEIKEEVLSLIQNLRDQGKGILISTHLLEEIEALADDFILLDAGRVFMSGDLKSHQENEQVVTFSFDKDFDFTDLQVKVVSQSTRHVSIQTDKEDAKEILKTLISKDQSPYKIEWSGILKDNYKKILDQ